ncbi:MAG: DUF4367 domain-containing protein [Oscillospiraceae bacterium]|nr:DUF4367 domain-containing protein [Oscillospiraceae bacterium]
MTFDDLIAQGIRDTLDKKCAEYPLEGKKHHFSLGYKIRRRRMLRSLTKGSPFSSRKLRLILIAVILALFALTGFSLWRQFGGFSFNIFRDHSNVFYDSNEVKTAIEEIYFLSEEYELISITSKQNLVRSKYMVDGEIVTLNQYLLSHVNIANTENNNVEYLLINGNDGYYLTMFENINYVMWIMDGYQFQLSGEFDKNAAKILAESLKIRNSDKIP